MTQPPEGLSPRAVALWQSVTDTYELRADELVILTDACLTMTRVDEIDAAQKELPLIAKGSTGQAVVAPLIAEARQQRGLLAALLRQLHLADVDEDAEQGNGEPMSRSESGRKAAQARWQTRRPA